MSLKKTRLSAGCGTFEWEIKSKALTEILNAENGEKWTSKSFTISGLDFELHVYPNEKNKTANNSFRVFVKLLKWPGGVQSIIMCASQFCKQTMTSFTTITTYTQTSMSKGWASNILLLSDINKNVKCLNIGVNINILCITYNESSSLYFNKTLNNINNINYKKKQSIKWHINSKLLSLWKQARTGQMFESKIFNNQWMIYCYPQGKNNGEYQEYMSIHIQICSLPPTVKKMKVKCGIKCVETNDIWNDTYEFSYDNVNCGTQKLMKSTKMNKYSILTFIGNVEIIDDINNVMEEKEERKMNLITRTEKPNILNAKIISLASQIEKQQKQSKLEIGCLKKSIKQLTDIPNAQIVSLTHMVKKQDEMMSELKNELNIFKQEQNNMKSYVFEEKKENITNITSELLTQRIKLETLKEEMNNICKKDKKISKQEKLIKWLTQNGFDDMETMEILTEHELNIIGMTQLGHKMKLPKYIRYPKLNNHQPIQYYENDKQYDSIV